MVQFDPPARPTRIFWFETGGGEECAEGGVTSETEVRLPPPFSLTSGRLVANCGERSPPCVFFCLVRPDRPFASARGTAAPTGRPSVYSRPFTVGFDLSDGRLQTAKAKNQRKKSVINTTTSSGRRESGGWHQSASSNDQRFVVDRNPQQIERQPAANTRANSRNEWRATGSRRLQTADRSARNGAK